MELNRPKRPQTSSWKKALLVVAGMGAGLVVALILADATEPYGTPEA
jgi:uncharacterized protein involved in exopolysaccharide biosynthesis